MWLYSWPFNNTAFRLYCISASIRANKAAQFKISIVNSGLRPPLALALDQAEDSVLWHELLSTRVLSCNTACLQFTRVTLHSLYIVCNCILQQETNIQPAHKRTLSALMYQEAETPLKLPENFMGWVRGNLDNSKTGRKVLRGAIWKFISVGTCSYQIKSMYWCSLKTHSPHEIWSLKWLPTIKFLLLSKIKLSQVRCDSFTFNWY